VLQQIISLVIALALLISVCAILLSVVAILGTQTLTQVQLNVTELVSTQQIKMVLIHT
jgi:hypothetical protein